MDHAVIWNELQRVAERVPDRIALQGSEPGALRFTYRETIARARAVGDALGGAGVRAGDRVALWSPVSPSWAIAYLGILYSGGVVVPLDPAGRASDAAAVLRATDSTLLVGAPEMVGAGPARDAAREAGVPIVLLDVLIGGASSPCRGARHDPHGARPSRPTVDGTDIATIIFTSGTTGTPRGVVLSHAAVSTTIAGMRAHMDLAPGDNVLAIVPSHHVFAPVGNLLVPLAAGAAVTYVSPTSSGELLRIIREAGITVFPSVPQVFYALHRRILDQARQRPLVQRWLFFTLLAACRAIRRRTRLNPGRSIFGAVHRAMGGRLRVLVSGGSYCDPAVIRDLDALGFTVQQGYGLTETFGGGTLTTAGDPVPGSAGVPLPGMQVRIVDPDADGVGEIAIAGPSVMQGYLHDADATAAALPDGWLRTGDVGYVGDRSHLFVTGRRSDLIVLSSGKKVAPETLERHYAQSRAIAEICILGVRDRADYAGSERLHAVVVPDFEYLKSGGVVNSREVIRSEIERLSRDLPPFQRVLSYEVRAAPLPRTATRKIVRWQVAGERAADATAAPDHRGVRHPDDEELCRTEPGRRVLALIEEEARAGRRPDPSMNLELDLGIDSLKRIELIATVEQALGARLPPDAASQCVTVRDLLRATASQRQAASRPDTTPHEDRRVRWRDILDGPEVTAVSEPVLNVHPAMSVVQFAALRTIRIVAAVLFRFSVRGVENLPRRGAYLICPNHQSYLDGALLASALPYRVIRHFVTLGWPTFFSGGLKTALARATNCVPIDPDTNLRRAMVVSAAALKQGKVVLIFPEGGLTWDGRLQPFKKGPAILARELAVPVVPAGITGTYTVWPKGGGGPRRFARITLTFGKPIEAADRRSRDDAADAPVEQIARRLREEIGALVGA